MDQSIPSGPRDLPSPSQRHFARQHLRPHTPWAGRFGPAIAIPQHEAAAVGHSFLLGRRIGCEWSSGAACHIKAALASACNYGSILLGERGGEPRLVVGVARSAVGGRREIDPGLPDWCF